MGRSHSTDVEGVLKTVSALTRWVLRVAGPKAEEQWAVSDVDSVPGSDARLCMEALLVPAEFCMKTGVMEGWILKSQCEKQCHDLARAFKRAQGETKMLSHTEMWGETRVSRRGFALFMRVLPLSVPPRPRNMRRRGAFSAKLTPPTVLVLIATLLCDSAAT